MEKSPLISIIIPVYNEQKTVKEAIQKVYDLSVDKEIIVVDDGSTDSSGKIIEELQKQLSFRLIKNPVNKGKGASVISGARIATGKFCIVEDADLELNPQDILRMLHIIQSQKIQLVNGNRRFSNQKKLNLITQFAKILTRFMLLILFRKHIDDLLSSYKLCRLEDFRKLDIKSKRFNFETEFIIKALKLNWKIVEVPIDYYPRKAKEGKKISLMDGVKIIFSIIRLKFGYEN